MDSFNGVTQHNLLCYARIKHMALIIPFNVYKRNSHRVDTADVFQWYNKAFCNYTVAFKIKPFNIFLAAQRAFRFLCNPLL